jgi:murein DD-endopeptidase MepM/ murein hydrolase activator NlpD
MASTSGIDALQIAAATASAAAPADGSATPGSEKLHSLAAQFEAMFLSQMLSEMRGSMFGGDEDEDKESGFGGSPLSDAMYSQLSVALGKAGGIGLAQSMMGALSKQAGAAGDSTNTSGLTMGFDPMSAITTGVDPMAVSALSPATLAAASAVSATAAVSAASVSATAAPVAVSGMPGRLSSDYGWRRDPIDGSEKFHKGVDLALPLGSDVPAARAGQVSFAGEMSGYGLTVEISHGDGVSTRYAHLSELDVKAGDDVAAGQTIAKSGSTGRSTGPHLHFEVLDEGQAVEPSAGWALLQASR